MSANSVAQPRPLLAVSRTCLCWALCLTFTALTTTPGWAQEAIKLLPSDGVPNAEFGRDVALSGDAALIGAPLDTENGPFSGSAYVFRRDGDQWIEEAKLFPSDGATDDYFGSSVALVGNLALVGAPFVDDNGPDSGSVYVFEHNGTEWVQATKLTASDGLSGDIFGTSIAFDGEVAIIGASFSDNLGTDSGSAYVLRYDGTSWTEEAKLLASDGAAFDFFGNAVAVYGTTAFIGAQISDNSGRVYVYERNGSTWTEQQQLVPSDLTPGLAFGFSIALDSETAFVGAIGDDTNQPFGGSAYVFRRAGETWVEDQKIVPSDVSSTGLFGYDVALSGDVAVVGARDDSDFGFRRGSVYVYDRAGAIWERRSKLSPDQAAEGDGFGGTVSISEGNVLVGALFDGDNGELSGSAYVFPSLVATSTEAEAVVSDFALRGTYPNPATHRVRIDYVTGRAMHVRLALYDVLGREVVALQEGQVPEGMHTTTVDTGALAPGIYLLRAQTKDTVVTRRLTVVR